MPQLPTPHYKKLTALLQNQRLPDADKERIREAISRYRDWISGLEKVGIGQKDAVEIMVALTNRYKRFIELDIIFDSPEDFLYRQKGQLKIDNTILEEFLPQLVYRSLKGLDETFELGPQKTFAGLSFQSSIANPGAGGDANIRTKDQDFIIGRKLWLRTSFDSDFRNSETIESHLGFICGECKTNLDKTMFQEAVATSRDLKIAVPASLYFLICEFLDMTPVSITSTHIDDVLIVRKAKRTSSNIRQKYRDSDSRRRHRSEYADFLDSACFHPGVFQIMIDKIQKLIDDTDPHVNRVLDQGHF